MVLQQVFFSVLAVVGLGIVWLLYAYFKKQRKLRHY